MKRDSLISPRVAVAALAGLTEGQRLALYDAQQEIPRTPWAETPDQLWDRLARGEVQLLTGTTERGEVVAGAFFQITPTPWGGRQFLLLDTVALAVGVDAAATMLPLVERIAADNGCDCVTIPTVRPGLVKLLTQRHGYTARQVTLAKPLNQN